VKISNYIIDNNSEPFIIAEAGINHNGEIEKAFEMIEVAKNCGCNVIKFQTYKTEEFILDKSLTYTYLSQGKEITESQYDMFKRYEFSKYEWNKIKACCNKNNMMFLSTPQNISDLNLLLELGIPAIKVGSDDFNNISLLKQYKKTKLPIILSCGMSYLHEIHNVLNIFENNYPLILMLCTSQYPTPYKDVNIFKLQTLKEWFGHKVILGFSDHTQSSLSASMAVALGARVFEKHFTLSNALPGPDHWFSENPNGLMKWVNTIKGCYKILGSSEVKPTDKEKEMRKIARRSIVALKDISVGEKLTVDNIGLHRPGIGIPAEKYESLLGSFVLNKIHKGKLIEEDDFY
jgi:sialic acid synthase SpsE